MARIVISDNVHAKLEELVETLYNTKYFGYRADAKAYVDAIYAFIDCIPDKQHYATQNQTHGAWFCAYRPNKHTTWFATFDKQADQYIVRNLFNNHTIDYPTFIKGGVQ